MKLMVNSTNFNGYTRFLSCNSGGKYKTVSDYPYGRRYFGDTRGLSELVKKHSFPFASIEETIGKFHDNVTYKVYVTDPYEVVTDLIRRNNDYIVFDNEPKFQKIEFDYFDLDGTKKRMLDIKNYFLRLINSGNSDKSKNYEAEKEVNFVDKFLQIYEKSQDKIEEINILRKRFSNRTDRLQEMQNNIPIYTKELAKKRNSVLNNKKNLLYTENTLKKDAAILQQNENSEKSEVIKERIKNKKAQMQIITKRILKAEKRISYLENYLSNAPDKITALRTEAAAFKDKLNKCEQLIKPEYINLYKFCIQSGKIISKYF